MTKGYIICFVPRSGSTWLSQMLTSTKLLGEPKEFFHEKKLLENAHTFHTLKEYATYLKSLHTVNDVFGMKVTWTHFQALIMGTHSPEELFDIDFKYIWLDRKDTIMQGLSEYRAMSTGYFHNIGQDEKRPPLEFDKPRILDCMAGLAWERTAFPLWLKRHNKRHAQIHYEDIVKQPEAVIALVAHLMEITIPDQTIISYHNRALRNQEDFDWKKRLVNAS